MSMFIGEALSGDGNEIAHIDLLIGSKDGPVGVAFANALARQVPVLAATAGVLALLLGGAGVLAWRALGRRKRA